MHSPSTCCKSLRATLCCVMPRCSCQVEPLKVAIEGRYNAFKDEREKPDINGQNAKGHVALHLAICNERTTLEPMAVLLERGADANARDASDLAPLHVVASMCALQGDYKSDHFEAHVRCSLPGAQSR